MKAGQPVAVTAGSVDLMQVYCAPISVAPPNGTTYAPLQVGALMGGVEAGGDWDTQGYFLRLAATCGPAFLNVALSNVEPLSHFLSLRDSDTRFLSVQVEEEEDFQDIPSDLLVSSTELDVQHAENVEVARPSTSSNQSSRASLTLAPSTPALDQVAGCAFQDRCSLEDKRQEHEKEVDEAEDGADSYGSKGSLHSNSSSSQVNWKKSSNMWRARSIAAGLFIMLIFVSMVVWVWTVDGRRDHSHLLPWSPGAGSLVEL